MSSLGVVLLVMAASAAEPPPITLSPGQEAIFPDAPPLPASARAIVDHVDALYRGNVPLALTFVSDDVQNVVGDATSNLNFPPGRTVTGAMYGSMTKRGALTLSWFRCAPSAEGAVCDMTFGTGKAERRFVMRYAASNGPITRIKSWEEKR